MNQPVDARGLSCPQPVIMTLNKIKEVKEGEIVILVNTVTARENVSRAATSRGWTVADIQQEEEDHRITLRKEG